MKVKLVVLLLVVAAMVLAGCGGAAVPQPANANRPPVPTPSASSGIVTGQALSAGGNTPITGTPVYLAQIHWDSDHKSAAYVLNMSQSPATLTDQNGFFVFTTVPPNEYALIVGDYDGNSDVVRESNGNARIYQIEAGKTFDTGRIQVNPIVQRTK